MYLEGKIYAGDQLLSSAKTKVVRKKDVDFTKSLDVALVSLCHTLNLPNLFWFSKNTREFARYRQTIFSNEQFSDPVNFTQFHIKLLED